MKIYFEKFGEGCTTDYLTPMKIYEEVAYYGNSRDLVNIKDDEGDEITVCIDDDLHTLSSWKILSEENT